MLTKKREKKEYLSDTEDDIRETIAKARAIKAKESLIALNAQLDLIKQIRKDLVKD